MSMQEETQEIEKQLGCMNGIFQLFDRRYLLGQRRRNKGQGENGNKEFRNASQENRKTMVKEKHRVSVESSRNSFSSSCSSLDCSKKFQTEQSSFCPSIVSEPPSPRKQQQPPDIREVVKDSMTRKPRVVPVKTVAKDERKGPTMTHVDSPRPLLQSCVRKDQNLVKLGGVKDSKRFSCDGRESPYKLKSKSLEKELPRLSLDSKQSSRRIVVASEPGSNKRQASSVVARLMGLEIQEFIKKPDSNDDKILVLRSKSKISVSARGIGNGITRIPLEPAPWTQPAKHKKRLTEKVNHGYNSVYGDIEKRLTEKDFISSGKDLRALKQILEAIQRTKMKLEKKDEDLDQKLQPISPIIKRKQEIHTKVNKVNHIGRGGTTPMEETKAINRSRNATSPSKGLEYPNVKSYCNSRNSGKVSPRSNNGMKKQPKGKITKDLSQECISSSLIDTKNEIQFTSTYQNRENTKRKENQKNKVGERLIDYKPMGELSMATVEQASPVSVLDAFYTEDAPSPIQNKSYAFKEDEDLLFNEQEWNQIGIDNIDQTSFGFNHPKIGTMIHQIELQKSTMYHLYETTNGDRKYINEILLASGFPENLECATTIMHLHPNRTLINPELFNILERTHEPYSSKPEKIRRKLIFDTVNNLLAEKLARLASSRMRKTGIVKSEKLMNELWSEIHDLEMKTEGGLYDEIIDIMYSDVNKRSVEWDDNLIEVSDLVLDIERLIFKDLISEIMNVEDGPKKHCRKLFLV